MNDQIVRFMSAAHHGDTAQIKRLLSERGAKYTDDVHRR